MKGQSSALTLALALAVASTTAFADEVSVTADPVPPARTWALPTADDFRAAVVDPSTPQRAYKPLRYDEDWRWLRTGAKDHDLFDPIKDIPLGPNGDLSVSAGGSARARYEWKINPGFGAYTPGNENANPTKNDDYFLYRWYFHTDFRYRDVARFFIEGVGGYIDGDRRNPPPTSNPSEHADVHQAFVDLSPFGKSLTLRVGRQELLYDRQKLVGPSDWSNVRRSYDGVKLIGNIEDLRAELFWVRPVQIEDHDFNCNDEETNFAGLHLSRWWFNKDHNLSFFTYYLNRSRDTKTSFSGPSVTEFNPDGRSGNTDRVTIGSRFWGKFGQFDYDLEGGVQVGTFGSEDICPAGYVALEAGYTVEEWWGKPRFSIGYDYASGDDKRDGRAGTFDQLFPTGHLWLGYLDLVGRQNINAFNATVSVNPTKELKIWGTWHYFCLADSNDALYNASGAAIRFSPNGNAGNYVGNEFDLTATYQIGRHTTLLAGYGVFCPGDFIQNTGKSETVQMVYTSIEFKY